MRARNEQKRLAERRFCARPWQRVGVEAKLFTKQQCPESNVCSSFQIQVQRHFSRLELAAVGVFTPRNLANTTRQGFPFRGPAVNFPARHLCKGTSAPERERAHRAGALSSERDLGSGTQGQTSRQRAGQYLDTGPACSAKEVPLISLCFGRYFAEIGGCIQKGMNKESFNKGPLTRPGQG